MVGSVHSLESKSYNTINRMALPPSPVLPTVTVTPDNSASNTQSGVLTDYNFFKCNSNLGSYYSLCAFDIDALEQESLHQMSRMTAEAHESSYLFKTSFDFTCSNPQLPINLFVTADGGITWAGPIFYGTTTELAVKGSGPLKFKDQTPEETSFWSFNLSCKLSFKISKEVVADFNKQ